MQGIEDLRLQGVAEAVVYPGDLPFGELAGGNDAEFDGLFKGGFSVEMLPKLAVADAAHGGVGGGEGGALAQGAYFVKKALRHHEMKTCGDALVERCAFGEQRKGEGAPRRGLLRLAGVQFAGGFAGELHEFVGADEALRIVAVDACRAVRVAGGQFAMQCIQSFAGGALFEGGAQCRVGRREVGKSGKDGVVVKHGAARKQGYMVAGVDGADQAADVAAALSGAIAGFRRQNVDEVVRVAGENGGAGFGAADVHAAVYLRGVHADDFQRQCVIQGAGEVGFAGCGRADEADNGRKVVCVHAVMPAVLR